MNSLSAWRRKYLFTHTEIQGRYSVAARSTGRHMGFVEVHGRSEWRAYGTDGKPLDNVRYTSQRSAADRLAQEQRKRN